MKITVTIAIVGSASHLGPLSTQGSHSIAWFTVPNWALKRIRNITAAATLETMYGPMVMALRNRSFPTTLKSANANRRPSVMPTIKEPETNTAVLFRECQKASDENMSE